ncbi:MAG: hypothetical protein WDN31_07335 [Hyphomicrobium sp.]
MPPIPPRGFLDVQTAIPDAIVEMRYTTAHNFVGRAIPRLQGVALPLDASRRQGAGLLPPTICVRAASS